MGFAPPGYFGKVPARGDFLSCRLGSDAGAAWDGWLERFTISVREAAGEAWPEAWLTAPLWHFVLGPGVVGAEAMAGVVVASVDRVGRMYPFSIIGASGGVPEGSWSDALEALVLDALGDGFEPSVLDQALLRLGPPVEPTELGAGYSVWSCRGSALVDAVRFEVAGLPDKPRMVAMVLGVAAEPVS